MKFPLSSFVLQLAAVYLSCFGAVTRGRAIISKQQVSTLPLTGAQERPFMTLYNNTAGAASVGHDYHSEATETSDGTPEDLERTPTFYDRAASIEHEDSLSKSGLHNSQETFGTDPLHTSSATAKAATLHRRIERDAQKPWLPDDEGSGFSSETELDDEDLFLQQRRAARRGRKEGRTPGRRKNVDWLQLQGVTSHRVEQKSDHSRPQAAGKNELPSPEQAPRNGDPTRRPQHTGAAKRRPKKRHRTKATKHAPSRQLPDTKPVSSSGSSSSAGHGSQQHHRQQQQQQQQQQPEQGQPLQTHRTAPAQPPPRKFGGGDMSLESRIRALKKIASGSQEDELTAAHSPELPAFYSGDSPGWSARDEWASGWDHRLWHVLGSGSGSGTQPYGDPGRPDSGLVPPPPMPATPPPTPPPPPCRSTAATPVSAAGAAHNPPPTQSRHFAYHRVTEAQSVAAASHHQEAFVAVSMVELPGNHSRNHSNKNHDQTQQQQQHQHVSPENLSTRTARWETPDTTTAASFFPVAVPDSDISLSSDYWDSGGLEALPTWFRLRHRGRNHFRKGAMEALMNRHREEQWLRRRFGLPPESPHQQFAG